MLTLKKVATLCLFALLVVAVMTAVVSSTAVLPNSADQVGRNTYLLSADTPTPTATPGANPSNPSGGGSGG